jgi:hypothetical protein
MDFPEMDLISREELLDMFKKQRPPADDFPTENKVWRCNNHLVEEWDTRVLLRMPTTDGKIALKAAMKSFEVFAEGKEVIQFKKYEDLLSVTEESKVPYWVEVLLNSPIEELYPIGSGNLMDAWMLITRAIKFHFAREKWQKVYSQSEDPLIWLVLTAENFKDHTLPFGLDFQDMTTMEKKIKTIVQMKPGPC